MSYVLRFEDKNKASSAIKHLGSAVREIRGLNFYVEQLGKYLVVSSDKATVEDAKEDANISRLWCLQNLIECEVVKTGEYEDRHKFLDELKSQK